VREASRRREATSIGMFANNTLFQARFKSAFARFSSWRYPHEIMTRFPNAFDTASEAKPKALLIEFLPSPSLLAGPSAFSLLGQIRRVSSSALVAAGLPRDAPARSEFQSVVLGCSSALVALASACIDHIDEENQFGWPIDLGLRGACARWCAKLGRARVARIPRTAHSGIWRSLELADGQIVPNAAAFVSDDNPSVCFGCDLWPRCCGGPRAPCSRSHQQETEANAARSDGRQLALVPFGGFVYAGLGYLFYDHALVGPGIFDEESQGTGLCVRADQAVTCIRVTVNGDTILWKPDQRILNSGGLVVDDRALVYGLPARGQLLNPVHGIGSLPNGRLVCGFCLIGRDYSAGVGLDLHARYVHFARVQPFISGYAEQLGATCCRNGNSPTLTCARAGRGRAVVLAGRDF